MGRLIKTFADGSILEYDQGGFDHWCVYLTRPNQLKHAPKDIQYLSDMQGFAKRFSPKAVYADFVAIFDATGKQVQNDVLVMIEKLSQKYIDRSLEIQIILTILYAAMVAEENKQFSRLGKRIKRLGLHQMLFDGMTATEASTFSKGKGWRTIAAECQKRGF